MTQIVYNDLYITAYSRTGVKSVLFFTSTSSCLYE